MRHIFLSALQKIAADLKDTESTSKLNAIKLRILPAHSFAKSLHATQYRRYTHIPAYYDPNGHSVYLNQDALLGMPAKTIHLICYHELVHAVSRHDDYWQNNVHFFQSGLKIETYRDHNYTCANRLLNEGITQFLTVYFNNVESKDYAYRDEVKLIEQLVGVIGFEAVRDALLSGKIQNFIAAFEFHFGRGQFHAFTNALEKQNYSAAQSILASAQDTPELQAYPLPFTMAVQSSASMS